MLFFLHQQHLKEKIVKNESILLHSQILQLILVGLELINLWDGRLSCSCCNLHFISLHIICTHTKVTSLFFWHLLSNSEMGNSSVKCVLHANTSRSWANPWAWVVHEEGSVLGVLTLRVALVALSSNSHEHVTNICLLISVTTCSKEATIEPLWMPLF